MPNVNSFKKSKIILGSVLESPHNNIVIPRSTSGTFSNAFHSWVEKNELLEFGTEITDLGDLRSIKQGDVKKSALLLQLTTTQVLLQQFGKLGTNWQKALRIPILQ